MNSTASDVKSWLQSALIKENLVNFSVNILGNSTKGDGYMGDIIFVHLSAQTKENNVKEYNLVLKCSKDSQTVRDSMPVKEIFGNEIYLYDQIFPAFERFQLEKGIHDIFNSVPKCYGTFSSSDREVIILENLKSIGYTLHDRKIPLNFEQIKLIVSEYGKWHAISAAMQDQQLEKFQQLVGAMKDVWKMYDDSMDVDKFFSAPIDEIHELVKNDVSQYTAEKLINFKSQISYMVRELLYDRNYFAVITHGDCWSNNFMFKYEGEKLMKVAILDWQESKFCSPVIDLSYFIYSCISNDDLTNFDDILKIYYNSFSSTLKCLGSNPDNIFSYSQFLVDWKIFARIGILMAFFVLKIAVCNQDEVADVTETLENGLDLSDMFLFDVKDKIIFKNRVLCIVEHCVERDLI